MGYVAAPLPSVRCRVCGDDTSPWAALRLTDAVATDLDVCPGCAADFALVSRDMGEACRTEPYIRRPSPPAPYDGYEPRAWCARARAATVHPPASPGTGGA